MASQVRLCQWLNKSRLDDLLKFMFKFQIIILSGSFSCSLFEFVGFYRNYLNLNEFFLVEIFIEYICNILDV